MKKSYRFVALCLALTAFFCIISAVCTAVCLENVRKTTNSTVNRLVAVMLEKYPDVSEKEVAEILNNKTEYTDNSEFLNKYGIYPEKDWISYNNQGSYKCSYFGNYLLSLWHCFYSDIFIIFKNAKATDYGNSKAD